ncbi:MAG TPA: hypothetical protein VIU86_20090 [Gaiellaceae bacterium]
MKITKIGEGLCVIAGLIWLVNRNPSGSSVASASSVKADAPLEQPEEITAARLAQDFANNEAAAEDRYRGRCLHLQGIVTKIDAGLGDEPSLWLAAPGDIVGVMVTDVPREWAKKLNRGDSVILDVEGAGEVVSQAMAKYSSECHRRRDAFEADAQAKRAAQAQENAAAEASKAATPKHAAKPIVPHKQQLAKTSN